LQKNKEVTDKEFIHHHDGRDPGRRCAALLLPWHWLTLAAVAGLTIDMAGALYTQMRIHDSLDAITPAIVMVTRLAALALLAMRGRWVPVAVGAGGRIAVALAGAIVMLNRNAP
jgi:DoxX-like family